MKKLIAHISKTNLRLSCLLACILGVVTNTIFNGVGGLMFDASSVGMTNNLLDAFQMFSYVAYRLSAVGSLSRFDLPVLMGSAASLVV